LKKTKKRKDSKEKEKEKDMSAEEEQKQLALAKEIADKPTDGDEKKKLWLRIVQHVIENEKDIKKAIKSGVSLLGECELLKIEDILPFFPSFEVIDDFKKEICTSLEDYNSHIETLIQEMEEATRSAESIRLDIHDLRNRSGVVGANQKCDLCGYPVMSRNLYLFPCQHVYHADCLETEVKSHLSNAQLLKLMQLQNEIQNGPENKIDEAQEAYDDIVASECIYCGEFMVQEIDKPFIEQNEEASKVWYV